MTKSRVKVTEIQPGILLYQPTHKLGVLSAIRDFCKGKMHHNRSGCKKWYHSTSHKRKQRCFKVEKQEKLF